MLSDLLLLGLHSGAREAFAYPAEANRWGTLGRQVGSFFALFSHLVAFFSHFWGLLRNHSFFNRFFSNFNGFWMDLGRVLGWILGRFLDGFSRIVGISRKNCDFVETLKKPRFLQCFVKVDLLKNNKKSTKYL